MLWAKARYSAERVIDSHMQAALRVALLLVIVGIAAWASYWVRATLVMPYQVGFREGMALVNTGLLLQGQNPFSLENQPLGMTEYGILYNLAVLPAAYIFGNTLLVHRAVTLLFVVLSAGVLFVIIRRNSGDPWLALLAGLLAAIGFMGRGGLGAFPHALGTFLMLAALAVPCIQAYTGPSLLASAVLSVAAFYAKPYFMLSAGIVGSYLFLFRSTRKAIQYALAFGLVFASLYAIVRWSAECYFIDTLVANWSDSVDTASVGHLLQQAYEAADEYFPLLILSPIVLIANLVAGWKRDGTVLPQSEPRRSDRPLIRRTMEFWTYAFLCGVLIFVLILGPHIGNYMSYFYQIVSPLFLVWLFSHVRTDHGMGVAAAPLLIVNVILLARMLLSPGLLEQSSSPQWQELYRYVNSAKVVLNSPVVAARLVERGIWPTDAGQIALFRTILPYPHNALLGPSYSVVKQRGDEYEASIRDAVSRGAFDVVILSEGRQRYDELLPKHYLRVDRITVRMPRVEQRWTVAIWMRNPDSP